MTPDRYRPPAIIPASAAVHVLALGSMAVEPARWPLAVGAMVANHAALVLGGLFPRCRILGANLTRLSANKKQSRAVAVTFDDGPHPEITPRVLDVLEMTGATATFFCVGQFVERHDSLVREMAERGHRIENHTWSHSNSFAFLKPGALADQISRTQAIIKEVTGRAPEYFRAPAGIRSPWLDAVLHRSGLRLVSWTRRGFDAIDKNANRVSRRLTRNLQPGDILLLHDGGKGDADQRSGLLCDVLPRLLTEIERKGLHATALP